MITVTIDRDELVIRVPRRAALFFSSLIEAGASQTRLAPNEIDFRQRAASEIIRATAALLRARPEAVSPQE